MPGDDQNFLRRWSRLKQEASVKPVPSGKEEVSATSPELPALDSLNFESDFGAFMRARVDESIRRAALKKLFSDPRFNIMDGLDVYIDDYSKEDPIPPGMLAQLQHAKTTLFGPRTEEKTEAEDKTPEDTQTSAGTPPLPASSNEPPLDHCEADLVSKPGQ
jgi:uncharacterized protein DUF3306